MSKKCLISFIILTIFCFTSTQAANFDVINQCPYTVWAAASPGGGRRLETGQSWQLRVAPGKAGARIWGRTNCNVDANGRGKCETDSNNDFPDISLIDEFNIPMEFSPVDASFKKLSCAVDLNNYSRFFKDRCPDAYSYPQDDPTSQSSCPGGTNYKVVFCR
ncbi:thaumatin-like protein 2 [Artemisia annua]|uniref:Thaumatin-like protein 2 n=1 Tax=Artemisia annua TaxID=35608 RepID=A0A2U1Q208_ARTAN|nr:thaumatin-like protein 2 [Artemisia annua]